jgi:hypothetical protein
MAASPRIHNKEPAPTHAPGRSSRRNTPQWSVLTSFLALPLQGMKVAVIEGHDIGGTCVNRGCVPSKALLAASGRIRDMKNEMHMKSMGIQVTAIPTLLLSCDMCMCSVCLQDAVLRASHA